jgi:prepilin-type processing-associated H-X9-DG protein
LWPTLLPHLGEGALAARYRWDVSFDDPANRPAATTPVLVLVCPDAAGERAGGDGLAPADFGPIAASPVFADLGVPPDAIEGVMPVNGRVRLSDITDGTATTLLLVEAPGVGGWASPTTLVAAREFFTAGGWHGGVMNVVMADGSVRVLRPGTDVRVLAALVTRAGGEPVSGGDF